MQQGMLTGLADLYIRGIYVVHVCVLQVGTHSGVLKACRPSEIGHLSAPRSSMSIDDMNV